MRPQLEPEAVQSALEAVSHSEPLGTGHPLLGFVLVREHVEKPEQFRGDYAVLLAVTKILEACLLDVLGSDRRWEHDAPKAIAQDFASGNQRREMYSFLYYRYLRSDLGLSLDDIESAASVRDRTLRRRQDEGLRVLNQDLMDREIEARRRRLMKMLQLRIPYPPQRSLYGREHLVEAALRALQASVPVLLVGVPGVGKTSLAAEIAHALLPQLDDLYWLTLTTRMTVVAQLQEVVADPALEIPATELLASLSARRVLFVMEEVEAVHFAEYEVWYSPRMAWLCTSHYMPSNWHGVALEIPPLERDHARRFFETVRGDLPAELFPDAFTESAGIPGDMVDYLHLRRMVPGEILGHGLAVSRHYEGLWDRLGDDHCCLWSLMILADSRVTLSQLRQFMPISEEVLLDLVGRQVLKVSSGTGIYRVARAAAEVLVSKHNQVSRYLTEACSIFMADSPAADALVALLPLMANGLLDYLPEDLTKALLGFAAQSIHRVGLWEGWGLVLHQVRWDDAYWRLWLALEWARVNRWRGFHADSFRHLKDIVDQAGGQGFFDLYGRGLLEIAIIALYRQQWQLAVEAAEDAAKVLDRLDLVEQSRQAILVHARAVSHISLSVAFDLVTAMANEDAAAALLAADILLRMKRAGDALLYLQKALDWLAPYSPLYGRALCTQAVALYDLGQYQSALECQQQAINLLTMTQDSVGLLRGSNNLGVIFHALGNPERAQATWQEALALALELQDRVALQTIRANLEAQPPATLR
jgi:tetratricopeptide (TPR) repeat protein